MSFQERKSGGLWKGLCQLKGSYRKLVVFLLFVGGGGGTVPKAHLWECWKISGHGGGGGGVRQVEGAMGLCWPGRLPEIPQLRDLLEIQPHVAAYKGHEVTHSLPSRMGVFALGEWCGCFRASSGKE